MNEKTGDEGEKEIKALRKSFDIIEIIKHEGPVRATAIAEQLDSSLSTVHYHLKTLRNHGYLINGKQGYSLGIRFLHLGGHTFASSDLYHAVNNEVPTLAMEVGESVQVAVEEYGKGYYVEHVSGTDQFHSTRHVGAEMYLHSTAAGKAILAELPHGRVNEIIQHHGLEQFTDETLSDRSALVDELQRIQERGIAFEVREVSTDESGIAVPLHHDDELVGALELTLPLTRIPDPRSKSKEERFPNELVDRVRETAQNIETHLGE